MTTRKITKLIVVLNNQTITQTAILYFLNQVDTDIYCILVSKDQITGLSDQYQARTVEQAIQKIQGEEN